MAPAKTSHIMCLTVVRYTVDADGAALQEAVEWKIQKMYAICIMDWGSGCAKKGKKRWLLKKKKARLNRSAVQEIDATQYLNAHGWYRWSKIGIELAKKLSEKIDYWLCSVVGGKLRCCCRQNGNRINCERMIIEIVHCKQLICSDWHGGAEIK